MPSDDLVYGSPPRITLTEAIVPSVDLWPVSAAEATPSTPFAARIAASTSAFETGPLSDSTSIVIGARTPGGKASSSSVKPSTLSTDFLKKVVVE